MFENNHDFYFLNHNNVDFECKRTAKLQFSPYSNHLETWSSLKFDLPKYQQKVDAIRKDFPFLSNPDNPIWFDNAATTQKPASVISAQDHFYREHYSNINRAEHQKSKIATEMYEDSRKTVASFLSAKTSDEIIFVRGTTEGINLLSNTLGSQYLKQNDHILLLEYEHHANLVPWQMLAKKVGAHIHPVPFDDSGNIKLVEYERLLKELRPVIVSLNHVSNILGTITPVKEMTSMAHNVGAIVVVDGAQAVSHLRVNVQDLDVDFYVFSGHKIFGPTAVGAIYGRKSYLQTLEPWQYGGNMIHDVSFARSTFAPIPARFEAGTPAIVEVIGLKVALDYVQNIGYEWIHSYETQLTDYLYKQLASFDKIKIFGSPKERASVIAFTIQGKEDKDVGAFLDKHNIALRVGHHCALPTLQHYGRNSAVRCSLSFYNTYDEVQRFIKVIHDYISM